MLLFDGYFSVSERRREKEESRERDERDIAEGVLNAQEVGRRNSLFSNLDWHGAKIVRRNVQLRSA